MKTKEKTNQINKTKTINFNLKYTKKLKLSLKQKLINFFITKLKIYHNQYYLYKNIIYFFLNKQTSTKTKILYIKLKLKLKT